MITADWKGQLQLSDELSATTQTIMILPQLKSASLISIGQLCDDNCDVLLNKTKLIAIKNNKNHSPRDKDSICQFMGYTN